MSSCREEWFIYFSNPHTKHMIEHHNSISPQRLFDLYHYTKTWGSNSVSPSSRKPLYNCTLIPPCTTQQLFHFTILIEKYFTKQNSTHLLQTTSYKLCDAISKNDGWPELFVELVKRLFTELVVVRELSQSCELVEVRDSQ